MKKNFKLIELISQRHHLSKLKGYILSVEDVYRTWLSRGKQKSPHNILLVFSIALMSIASCSVKAEIFTYWRWGNPVIHDFSDPQDGCAYVYSNNFFGLSNDIYMPDANRYTEGACFAMRNEI